MVKFILRQNHSLRFPYWYLFKRNWLNNATFVCFLIVITPNSWHWTNNKQTFALIKQYCLTFDIEFMRQRPFVFIVRINEWISKVHEYPRKTNYAVHSNYGLGDEQWYTNTLEYWRNPPHIHWPSFQYLTQT